MNARPPHGSARPGGRTARTRASVLAALYDALGAESFGALTLDKLAQRSGVHASTIRRRWRTVEGVVLDLLAERAATLSTPDSGDFRRDLHELARSIGDFNNALRNRNVIQGLVAAAAHDPRIEEIVRDTFVDRVAERAQIVRHAIDRGDLPPDTDGTDVIAARAAPFYSRVLLLRRPIDARLVRTSAEAAYAAARAGVFRTGADGQ